jgi:hypothetical protein
MIIILSHPAIAIAGAIVVVPTRLWIIASVAETLPGGIDEVMTMTLVQHRHNHGRRQVPGVEFVRMEEEDPNDVTYYSYIGLRRFNSTHLLSTWKGGMVFPLHPSFPAK